VRQDKVEDLKTTLRQAAKVRGVTASDMAILLFHKYAGHVIDAQAARLQNSSK